MFVQNLVKLIVAVHVKKNK